MVTKKYQVVRCRAMSSPAEQLRLAAAQGALEDVRAQLKAGAAIDTDLEGRTALHLSSANGHAAVVKALIEGGAKINALDAAGYSPLHQAATEGHEEVVKLLLKHGCHVDTQDELHGNTALHETAWKGFSRTLEILCRNKANVYIKNNGGFTPLHLACQNGHNQCCRVLLLSACKPDVRNNQYGDTPLHTAARYGHAGVLRILISAFCNVSETNKNGDTALHISAAMGRNKLTRILLEAGCDQKLKNNQGETARDIAERKAYVDVLKLMDNPPVTKIHVEEQPKKESKKSSSTSKKREKDSNTSQESKEKKDKHKKSKKSHKVHFLDKEKKKGNSSPYGCHMYPDMDQFPQLKLKSLPADPLQNGEQYYADLAGNIKKGPRGLGYMCYCAPFFNHVDKKLDANKQELLDHIDSRNEDLKAKISHLEQRTHDQLFSLNQKMKESLALERGECAERIDRRLFRERRELEQQQENTARILQTEMKALLRQQKMNGHCNGASARGSHSHLHNGNQPPLLRSKSEDLLSETNSNHNSVSMLSSTVTGASRFTGNSIYHRQYMNPAQCGTKPKANGHISRLKAKCMGGYYSGDLKRDSRSEGDLTSCHTDQESRTNLKINSYPSNRNDFIRSNSNFAAENNGALWRNTQFNRRIPAGIHQDNKSSGFQSDASNHYATAKQQFCANHNHDLNRSYITDNSPSPYKSQLRTTANGLPPRDSVPLANGNATDSGSLLPSTLENDGSSFV